MFKINNENNTFFLRPILLSQVRLGSRCSTWLKLDKLKKLHTSKKRIIIELTRFNLISYFYKSQFLQKLQKFLRSSHMLYIQFGSERSLRMAIAAF